MDKKWIQTVKDGQGWSPDGGAFIAKDNIIYWEDGDISDLNKGGVIRIMPDLNQGSKMEQTPKELFVDELIKVIGKFEDKTGVCVERITLDRLDNRTCGDMKENWLFGEIRLELK